MHRRQMLFSGAALAAASLALTAVPQVLATASLPTVSVRIEGKAKTLLKATTIMVRRGSITRFGAPAGVCPASSAQGALEVATRGNWSGTFNQKYQEYFVTKILGDTESGKPFFWTVLVNHSPASTGACALKLRTGDQLVFAAVPSTGTAFPIGLTAPESATAGHVISVKVVAYNAKGKGHPLAGAMVTLGAQSAASNAAGVVKLTPSHPGRFTLRAAKAGFIRDEAPVRVAG